MAATNFTPIQLYFSTTASAAPLAANLVQGELAINITDGKLYYEDNGGVVQVIATKGAGTIGGSTTQIQYNNAGALAGNAAMVFNNSTNVTTLTTLNLTNALGAIYGGTAQSTYTQGDFLYASATNTLAKLGIGASTFILTSTGSVPQWVAPSSIAVLTATNLAGGLAGSVPYQSALDTTTFLAIGAANRVMTSTGTAPQWVTSLTGLTGVSSSSITNTSLTSGRVVVSTTAGLQADDADLTFDGTTLSAGGFSTVGLSTLVKTVKIGDSSFNGVAVFAAATPAKLYMGTGTVTDVTSAISATNPIGAIASLGITPIAATNTSVTYTNAATLYIAGAPSAGTNVTLTNPYSLYVAAGDAYFGGTVTAGTVNLTTLDLTNLEVTNIKAKDGTAAITLADSTGVATFAANPILTAGTVNGVAFLNASKVLTTGTALTFDGSNLGIGTSSPAVKLHVEDSTANNGTMQLGGTTYYGTIKHNATVTGANEYNVASVSGGGHIFQRGGTTQFMTDASGNLGLGVTPSAWNLSGLQAFQVKNASLAGYLNASYLSANCFYSGGWLYTGSGFASQYVQVDSEHLWSIAPSTVTAGNPITFTQAMTLSSDGTFRVKGAGTAGSTDAFQVAGGAPADAARIDSSGNFLVGGTSNALGARLISENASGNQLGLRYTSVATWYNSIDSSGNYIWTKDGTNIARLDSSGNLLVGTTSQISGGKVSILGTSSTNTLCLQDGGSSNYNIRGLDSGGTVTFNLFHNGNVTNTNNSYGAISDVKLKENIVDASPKLADLMQVRVCNYNLIGGTTKQLGVVAQELETVFPSMIDETPDQDAEGNNIGTTTKAVKYSVFVPMLIKAIQEQQALITALTARITALESN